MYSLLAEDYMDGKDSLGAWGNRDWFSNGGMYLLQYGFVSVTMNQGLARLSLYVVFMKGRLTVDGRIGKFVSN